MRVLVTGGVLVAATTGSRVLVLVLLATLRTCHSSWYVRLSSFRRADLRAYGAAEISHNGVQVLEYSSTALLVVLQYRQHNRVQREKRQHIGCVWAMSDEHSMLAYKHLLLLTLHYSTFLSVTATKVLFHSITPY